MTPVRTVPLAPMEPRSDATMIERATKFAKDLQTRRTVRHFSSRPVPREVIEACLRAAGSAPSGANLQPWHFVAVADPRLKRQIRDAAEAEEREFYHSRAPAEWLKVLAPLGTTPEKPFLEQAPWLIAIFSLRHVAWRDGTNVMTHYPLESVGIATGLLITCLHHVGLATLTHTPSPMGFLNRILKRPADEKPFLLLVVGHPAPDARVPELQRRSLDQISTFLVDPGTQPDGNSQTSKS